MPATERALLSAGATLLTAQNILRSRSSSSSSGSGSCSSPLGRQQKALGEGFCLASCARPHLLYFETSPVLLLTQSHFFGATRTDNAQTAASPLPARVHRRQQQQQQRQQQQQQQQQQLIKNQLEAS
ncbi:hypothetical protein ACSSS7_002436 [Eimeria intestinalis]